jgi:hypothetical protein
LGIKFSALLVAAFSLSMAIRAQTSAIPVDRAAIAFQLDTFQTDTFQPDTLQPDTVQPFDRSSPLWSPDTLLPAQQYPGEFPEDTILPAVERQAGSGVILDARVDYSATDSIFFDIANQKVRLYGEADLKYDQIHLQADYVEIDFRKNELFAKGMPDSLGVVRGNPVFTEGPQSFKAVELRYNFESKRGRTVEVITQEADGYVHGGIVKIQPDRVIHVQEGKYTTCDDPEPHFHIAFRKAKLIPDDKIISSVAFLVIEGVPMPLFLPFGFFPNKRGQASGILMPSYGESAERGFYLENGGFYWGINDYLDLSLRGDIYSRGSWGLRMGSNYRVRYRYSGNVNLSYAINIQGERDLPGYARNRDFRVVWSHNQDPKARPNSTFRASVNAGSTQASRFNPISDQDYLTNTFSSNISYTASWAGRYNFSANARHSQNTLNRSVDLSLPELAFSVNRFYPFRRAQVSGPARWYEDINMSYSMNARNELRTLDSLLFEPETWSQFRSGVNHVIPISYSTQVLNHFNLSSSINYNERWYFQTIEKSWDEQAYTIQAGDTIFGRERIDTIPGFRAARDFNISTGLSTRVYGMMQFRRGPVRAIRHVVSPSLSLSYRPDFADPFWGYYQTYYNPAQDREIRYSIFEGGLYPGPMANRSGNIGFNITNNLEMKVRDRRDTLAGERKIALIDNLTISTGYDIARDSLNWSDIRVSGRTRLFGDLNINYSSGFTIYARDSLGRFIDRYIWEDGGKFFQLNNTSWSFALTYTFRSKNGGRQPAAGTPGGLEAPPGVEMGEVPGMPGEMDGLPPPGNGPGAIEAPAYGIDYTVPWTLNLNYSFMYNSRYLHAIRNYDRDVIQNLGVSGDIRLTPKWRVGFRTGFDFKQMEFTYTSVDIYRDLHCWEMTLNWVPFGYMKRYMFTIRVKSSVLQDLKLTRQTHHLDRGFPDF